MKKILKTAAAALAGMLAFGLAACTDGNDGYKPEVPTTYYEADKDYAGSGIAAKWDFNALANNADANDNVWQLTNSEGAFPSAGIDEETGGIKLSDGNVPADAVLVPSGGWKKNTGVLQSKNSNSSSLGKYDEAGGILKLTLEKQANIVIKAKGAGSAAPTRFIIIADKAGKMLAYKDNLSSGKDVYFTVKGAAAGEYTIYVNGSSICSIDLSVSSSNLTKPAQITELKLYQGEAEAPAEIPEFEVYETVKFTACDVTETGKEDMTLDAIWTSSNENVATVKDGIVTGTGVGTALIRARIGRFYDQRTVTVTESTKTIITFISGDKLPTTDVILVRPGDVKSVDEFLAAEELKPLLEKTVAGSFATATNATLSFNSGFAFLNDNKNEKAGFLKKGDIGDTDGTFGLYWRSATYNPKASKDKKYEEATFVFKVTPTGTSAKLSKLTALTSSNKGSGTHKLKVVVDSEEFINGFNKPAAITEIDLGDREITAETEIKVIVEVWDDKTRTGIQDLKLYIAE